MKKKYFIVFLLSLITLGVGFYVSFKLGPVQQRAPVIHYASKPPASLAIPDAPKNVVITFSGASNEVPSSAHLYRYTIHRYSANERKTIAALLSFTSSPIVGNYGVETRTVWKNNNASLVFTEGKDTQSWSYSLTQSPPKAKPTQPLSEVAKVFLEQSFFSYDPTVSLVKSLQSASQYVQIKESPPPTLYGFVFTKHQEPYPFLSSRLTNTPITIVIDEYGAPRSVVFVSQTEIIQDVKTPLISVSDAIASINNGLGALVSITKNGESYWSTPPQFTSSDLTSVKLVYYPNKDAGVFVPFYLFTGTANTMEGVIDVAYAVSATEQSN